MVSLDIETTLWDAGARVVVGVDEVGRGALAGPVSVGVAAVTRCDVWPEGLADSKRLRAAVREHLVPEIRAFTLAHAVGHASAREIDEVGIVGALRLAGLRALGALACDGVVADAVLLDGSHDWLSAPPRDLFSADAEEAVQIPRVTMVVKGDDRCVSIAAASVLAKVERDSLMKAAHDDHPAYGWAENKGYGAQGHLAALREHGPSPLHRVTWKLPAVVL